jgi:hypothetical protein
MKPKIPDLKLQNCHKLLLPMKRKLAPPIIEFIDSSLGSRYCVKMYSEDVMDISFINQKYPTDITKHNVGSV